MFNSILQLLVVGMQRTTLVVPGVFIPVHNGKHLLQMQGNITEKQRQFTAYVCMTMSLSDIAKRNANYKQQINSQHRMYMKLS